MALKSREAKIARSKPQQSSGGGGGGLGGLIGSLTGAGNLNVVDKGNEGTGEGTGAVSKQYSAAHPILDALFNEGRAGALAEARNYQENVTGREHQWQSERDAKQHDYAKEMVDKHLEAGKTLATHNSNLATQGYTASLAAKRDDAEKAADLTYQRAYKALLNAGHTPESATRQLADSVNLAQQADIAQKRGIISTAESDAASKNAANKAAMAGSGVEERLFGIKGEAIDRNRDVYRKQFVDLAEAPGIANAASKAGSEHTRALTEELKNPLLKLTPNEIALRFGSGVKSVTTGLGPFDPNNPMAARPMTAKFQYNLPSSDSIVNPATVGGGSQSGAFEGTNTGTQPKTQIDRTAASPAPVKGVLSKVDDPVYQAPAATVMPDPYAAYRPYMSGGQQIENGQFVQPKQYPSGVIDEDPEELMRKFGRKIPTSAVSKSPYSFNP